MKVICIICVICLGIALVMLIAGESKIKTLERDIARIELQLQALERTVTNGEVK